jgi:hypothetical protein
MDVDGSSRSQSNFSSRLAPARHLRVSLEERLLRTAVEAGLLLPLDMDKESMDSGLWMVVL